MGCSKDGSFAYPQHIFWLRNKEKVFQYTLFSGGLISVTFQDHNCVRELRTLVQQQNQKISEMQTEIAEHKLQINEQKRELQLLKVSIQSYCPLQVLTSKTCNKDVSKIFTAIQLSYSANRG